PCVSGNLGNHEATVDRNRDHCSSDLVRLEQTFRRMGGPDDRQSQLWIGRAWWGFTKKPGFLREALLDRPLTTSAAPTHGNCDCSACVPIAAVLRRLCHSAGAAVQQSATCHAVVL